MLSVKLVRSIVLGETITNPFQSPNNNIGYIDADLDVIDHHQEFNHHHHHQNGKKMTQKKLPILLFTPTQELISDTFRLATIARDIGMDFTPNSSLSHLLFSWPSSSSSSYPSSSNNVNYRTSVSSNTSAFTSTSSSTATTSTTAAAAAARPCDGVPIPFPSLSTTTSLSLLRSFISLSKGLFKLVFINVTPNMNPNFYNYYHNLIDYGCNYDFSLFSRVSGRRVGNMEELSRELAGKGWKMFRTADKRKKVLAEVEDNAAAAVVGVEDTMFLFRKMDSNRVRVRVLGGSNGSESKSRVRELRLPVLDFGKGLNLRVLLYILLMTDDVFYLA